MNNVAFGDSGDTTGRPAPISGTAQHMIDAIKRYEDAGVQHIVLGIRGRDAETMLAQALRLNPVNGEALRMNYDRIADTGTTYERAGALLARAPSREEVFYATITERKPLGMSSVEDEVESHAVANRAGRCRRSSGTSAATARRCATAGPFGSAVATSVRRLALRRRGA